MGEEGIIKKKKKEEGTSKLINQLPWFVKFTFAYLLSQAMQFACF